MKRGTYSKLSVDRLDQLGLRVRVVLLLLDELLVVGQSGVEQRIAGTTVQEFEEKELGSRSQEDIWWGEAPERTNGFIEAAGVAHSKMLLRQSARRAVGLR